MEHSLPLQISLVTLSNFKWKSRKITLMHNNIPSSLLILGYSILFKLFPRILVSLPGFYLKTQMGSHRGIWCRVKFMPTEVSKARVVTRLCSILPPAFPGPFSSLLFVDKVPLNRLHPATQAGTALAARASPGGLLERVAIKPLPRPANSNLWPNKIPRRFLWTFKCGKQ